MNSSLDANIILWFIRGDVPHQSKKVFRLLSDGSQVFHVSDLVVAEVIFNLQGNEVAREDIVEAVMRFCSLPNVAVNSMVTEQVLPFYLEHPSLSFVDCYAAFEADAKGAEPLWTFDRRLANQHPSAKRLD